MKIEMSNVRCQGVCSSMHDVLFTWYHYFCTANRVYFFLLLVFAKYWYIHIGLKRCFFAARIVFFVDSYRILDEFNINCRRRWIRKWWCRAHMQTTALIFDIYDFRFVLTKHWAYRCGCVWEWEQFDSHIRCRHRHRHVWNNNLLSLISHQHIHTKRLLSMYLYLFTCLFIRTHRYNTLADILNLVETVNECDCESCLYRQNNNDYMFTFNYGQFALTNNCVCIIASKNIRSVDETVQRMNLILPHVHVKRRMTCFLLRTIPSNSNYVFKFVCIHTHSMRHRQMLFPLEIRRNEN